MIKLNLKIGENKPFQIDVWNRKYKLKKEVTKAEFSCEIDAFRIKYK